MLCCDRTVCHDFSHSYEICSMHGQCITVNNTVSTNPEVLDKEVKNLVVIKPCKDQDSLVHETCALYIVHIFQVEDKLQV
jgi:hypothetical protein